MGSVSYKGSDGELVSPGLPSATFRNVRKMHSFDRRFKSAHQHHNPDNDTEVPSYMRQTCASLVKRCQFKLRDFETSETKPRTRESKKGKKLSKTTSLRTSPPEVENPERRHSTSSLRDRKSSVSASPRSELSAVSEASNESAASGSPSAELSPPTDAFADVVESPSSEQRRAEDVSALVEECYEHVLNDALTRTSLSPVPTETLQHVGIRGPSISSTMTLEDAYSEVAQDDSFCHLYDSDPDTKSPADSGVFASTFFSMTNEGVQPETPFTTHSARLASGNTEEDTFGVLDEANWLEEEDDAIDHPVSKLQSHSLSGMLDSFTDSEFGDSFTQTLLTTPRGPSLNMDRLSCASRQSYSSEFNIHIPMQRAPLKNVAAAESPGERVFERMDSSKLAYADGSFQIQRPSLLWMLGGNVLAGVVGAAIASAGMPLSSQETAPEVEEGDICYTPRSDGAHADDWFFQATSRVSHDE